MVITAFFGVLVTYLILIIPVLAIVLRAAVAVANKFLPDAPEPKEELIAQMETVADMPNTKASEDQAHNPFQAPATVSVLNPEALQQAIRTPGFGRAYLIVVAQFFTMIVLGGVVGAIIGGLRGAGDPFVFSMAIRGVMFACSLPLSAAILAGILPTTFGRGLLVAFLQMLVGFVLLFTIGFVIGMFVAFT